MEGVKGVKGGLVRPRPVGLDGLALLKGVDRCEIYPLVVEDLIDLPPRISHVWKI